MLYPVPYQSPAPVVFGPFSSDNMGEYALIQSWTWTSQTSNLNATTQYAYGVPFTLQSAVLAQKLYYAQANPTGGVGGNYDYIFGIYDDNGVLMCQTAVYGQITNTPTYRPAGANAPLGLAPFTTPTVLPPGNYYMTFFYVLQLGSGGTGLYAATATTPIQTNIALGVKEAPITWTFNVSTSLPSTVTWRAPTVTQCALVQMQGIGVSI